MRITKRLIEDIYYMELNECVHVIYQVIYLAKNRTVQVKNTSFDKRYNHLNSVYMTACDRAIFILKNLKGFYEESDIKKLDGIITPDLERVSLYKMFYVNPNKTISRVMRTVRESIV